MRRLCNASVLDPFEKTRFFPGKLQFWIIQPTAGDLSEVTFSTNHSPPPPCTPCEIRKRGYQSRKIKTFVQVRPVHQNNKAWAGNPEPLEIKLHTLTQPLLSKRRLFTALLPASPNPFGHSPQNTEIISPWMGHQERYPYFLETSVRTANSATPCL